MSSSFFLISFQMKYVLNLILLIIISGDNAAQNYRTFFPGKVLNYSRVIPNGNFMIQLKPEFDSIAGTDSIWKNFRSIDENHLSIYRASPWLISDTSILGRKFMTIYGNEDVLLNASGDSIHIKRSAQLNDTWIMCKYANGDYLNATISSISLQNFLGITDSVKTISLQRTDSIYTTVFDSINYRQLLLSENYGFIRFTNFHYFPSLAEEYELVGCNNPKFGKQILRFDQIYNFNPGDVFQYHSMSYNLNGKSDCICQYYFLSRDTDTIQNSIEYRYSDSSLCTYTSFVSPYTSTDLSDSIYTASLFLVPGSSWIYGLYAAPGPFNYDSSLTAYLDYGLYHKLNFNFASSNFSGRQKTDVFGPNTFSIYSPPHLIIDSSSFSYCDYRCSSFVEGLGCISSNAIVSYGLYCQYDLIYYKKGTEVWGTPVSLSNILSKAEVPKTIYLDLYPNPFSDHLNLDSHNEEIQTVRLISGMGKVVLEQNKIQNNSCSINTESLIEGYYILEIETKNLIDHRLLIKM